MNLVRCKCGGKYFYYDADRRSAECPHEPLDPAVPYCKVHRLFEPCPLCDADRAVQDGKDGAEVELRLLRGITGDLYT